MRAVLQRVCHASVSVDDDPIARIDVGLMVLLGIGASDTEDDVRYIARKLVEMRIFEDAEGKMNLSLAQVGGRLLVVPQFTLYGDCDRGRRPSFTSAARPEKAKELCEMMTRVLTELGHEPETGRFGAHMQVSLLNDGPVTLILESRTDQQAHR